MAMSPSKKTPPTPPPPPDDPNATPPSNSTPAPEQQPRFEDALAQLESIIEQIESGQVGLEESLLAYERGMKLVARCREILAATEHRIAQLTKDTQGKLQITPGPSNSEDNP